MELLDSSKLVILALPHSKRLHSQRVSLVRIYVCIYLSWGKPYWFFGQVYIENLCWRPHNLPIKALPLTNLWTNASICLVLFRNSRVHGTWNVWGKIWRSGGCVCIWHVYAWNGHWGIPIYGVSECCPDLSQSHKCEYVFITSCVRICCLEHGWNNCIQNLRILGRTIDLKNCTQCFSAYHSA